MRVVYGLIGLLIAGLLTLYLFSILKQDTWRDYESSTMEKLRKKGFTNLIIGKGSKDGGRDVIGYKDGIKYVVQCKKRKGTVGVKIVRELRGVTKDKKMKGDVAIIATTGKLSKDAKAFCRRNNIIIMK